MFATLSSTWFQSYCRALFENDPNIARVNAREAITAMNRRFEAQNLGPEEREALSIAIRYLHGNAGL